MEKSLYKIAWMMLAAGAGIALLLYLLPIPRFPCILYMTTGIYCPGCGGTRAVLSVIHGHPLRAFLYHPFVFYSAVVGGWFLLSQTVELISGGRLPIGMKYRSVYLYIGIVIMLVNWLVRNLWIPIP